MINNKNINRVKSKGKAAGRIKMVLILIALVGLLALGRALHLHERLKDVLVWIGHLGPLGMFIFVAIYIGATVLFLPGSILTLGAGVLFGVLKGTVLVSVGSTVGATAAFLIGRYLAREWVSRKIEGNPRFKAIDDAVAREGWKIVLLTRLSPVFPFNLLNYAFGLTKVSLKHYFFASWLGMLPGTVMYVYIGSLAGSLAGLAAGGHTRTTGEWVLYIIGLLATVAVTVFVTRIARQALKQRVGDDEIHLTSEA